MGVGDYTCSHITFLFMLLHKWWLWLECGKSVRTVKKTSCSTYAYLCPVQSTRQPIYKRLHILEVHVYRLANVIKTYYQHSLMECCNMLDTCTHN